MVLCCVLCVECCVYCGLLVVYYVAAFWAFCGDLCRAVLVHVLYGFGQCGVCHCVWIVSSVFMCAGLWVVGMWLGFAL